MYVQIHPFARLNTSKMMKFDSGSLWYLENENPSTTESWTDENFDLKNPRYEEEKKIHNFALRPFCQIRAELCSSDERKLGKKFQLPPPPMKILLILCLCVGRRHEAIIWLSQKTACAASRSEFNLMFQIVVTALTFLRINVIIRHIPDKWYTNVTRLKVMSIWPTSERGPVSKPLSRKY